jgi:hypothetical protein
VREEIHRDAPSELAQRRELPRPQLGVEEDAVDKQRERPAALDEAGDRPVGGRLDESSD